MKNSPQKPDQRRSAPASPSARVGGVSNQPSSCRLKNLLGVLIVVGVVLLIYSMLPLGTALRLGGDEGYELMKGFLVSKGYKLYQQIWCDQTPLFPILLGSAFRIWGPTILVARLIAAGFGLVLFGTFYQLVCKRFGWATAGLAVFFSFGFAGDFGTQRVRNAGSAGLCRCLDFCFAAVSMERPPDCHLVVDIRRGNGPCLGD